MRKANSAGLTETIGFQGHRNILGLHRNTIEVTKDNEISRRADCIIGVMATKACSDLSDPLKQYIQSGGHLCFEIIVGEEIFAFQGKGSNTLNLINDRELVLRRSNFSSERTGAIGCSAAAIDIPRSFIGKLQNPNSNGQLKITAFPDQEEKGNMIWSLP